MSAPLTQSASGYDSPVRNTDPSLAVEEHAPLVKRIALHMMARMPASVQLDDLMQAGMVGLLEAIQKYDDTKGASFDTYAGIRIRGAIVDEMRRGDWAPRSVHRNAREIAKATAEVEKRTGRDARDHEVAEALSMSMEEYYAVTKDSAATRLFSYEDTFEEDHDTDSLGDNALLQSPGQHVQRNALQAALSEAISQLPERERMVLSLYYDQELNLKEIGLVLGVSESRVSQIHSQAAMRLRARMTDWT